MKRIHEKRSPRVAEPIQVYLETSDRQRLERLADQLRATKSAVLRRGLEALERQLTTADGHPALRIIGIANQETGPPMPYDVAREHDRYLADLSDAGTGKRTGATKRAGKRGR